MVFFLIFTITQNIIPAEEGDSASDDPLLQSSSFVKTSADTIADKKESIDDIGKSDHIDQLNDEEYKQIFGQDREKKESPQKDDDSLNQIQNINQENNLQPNAPASEQNVVGLLNNGQNKAEIKDDSLNQIQNINQENNSQPNAPAPEQNVVGLLNNGQNKAEIKDNPEPNEKPVAKDQADVAIDKKLTLENIKKVKENLDTCLQQNELLKTQLDSCQKTKKPRRRNNETLHRENDTLREENKQLKEGAKCACSKEEPSKLKELWSACIQSKKDLENKIKQSDNKTLQQNIKCSEEIRILENKLGISNDHLKDICKKTGWCTGKEDNLYVTEDNLYVTFAENFDKQQELNLQEKTKLEQLISNEATEKEKQITEKEQIWDVLRSLYNEALFANKGKNKIPGWKTQESLKFIIDSYKKVNDDLEYEIDNHNAEKEVRKLLREECEKLSTILRQAEAKINTLNTDNTNTKNKLTDLTNVSNKLSERNKELKTTRGALDILFFNFVDTMIQHKIKIVLGAITGIAGYFLYKNKSTDVKALVDRLAKKLTDKKKQICNFIKI